LETGGGIETGVEFHSLSKTFSMTGWRVGYVVARNERIAKLLRLGGYTQTAGVTSFVQYAAARALDDVTACERSISEMKAEFDRRREALYKSLEDLPGVRVAKPQGAFYMFPNFTGVIPADRKGEAREKYIYELLMENGIASVYGACFGKHFTDNVRLSYSATPVEEIEEAGERFKRIFSRRAAA
ncbi:MAG: aminotransferase class I/II-fold pyridoxal phosphate-dependent enzyme, partial [Candidatus Krumholzibacteriia bacterium]